MSLSGSIRLGANALQAQQIGLQVIGQNIANANTPGYIREEVVFAPAPTQQLGRLLLGLGVQVNGIVQKIDHFLEERLRGATSDRANASTQRDSYLQLEGLIGELSSTDLSSSLNNFFSSISEILTQPESVSVRNLAVLQGRTLAADIQRLDSRAKQIRSDLNDRVIAIGNDINRLVEEIRTLNVRIAQIEGGDGSSSDAVGLRDQRQQALANLAELINFDAQEQSSGSVNLFVGGEFLVFEATSRKVEVNYASDRGLSVAEIRIRETNSPLRVSSGELAGLYESRDQILGNFIDQINSFATSLAFEFNKLFSSGQGLKGYSSLTSGYGVSNTALPLDAVGLPFGVEHGGFQVQVYNTDTKLTETTNIRVDLDGLGTDTSLADLVAQLDAVRGISATITTDRRVRITADSNNLQFAFADDTSGVLASLGLGVFFSGSTAADLGVRGELLQDAALFAASRQGIGADTTNAVEMANFLDKPLASRNGVSLATLYDRLTSEVTQASAAARATTNGFTVFEETLKGQKLAISGVSLDEEAVKLITLQRAFQATARYITTINDLIGILVTV
ncbi:MAG: flagellar hook-associated protein FlgK [Pirellulales bacterium]|nr:flagellar hook-associated protein FlgK [Pirellulales bacterium]